MIANTSQPPAVVLTSLLFFAVMTMSSAGVAFSALLSMGVPAALAASWRLWWCEIIQLLPFLFTLNSEREKDNLNWNEKKSLIQTTDNELFLPRYRAALLYMALSGIFLGIHFSAWVYAIEKTSLFHSLLWVSMGPIILNGGQWIIFLLRPFLLFLFPVPNITRPTQIETVGVIIGLSGAIIILFDIESKSSSSSIRQPTLEGDLAAFLGAFAVSMYLLIGRNLRSWIPLWLYTFPVIFFAIVTTVILAFLTTSTTWVGTSTTSVFGFINPKFILLSLYLGAGPGVCGHTLMNGLLKYVTPLTISTAMLSEPFLGSILGYFFGMQDFPGIYTCIGSLVLLSGLILVVMGENGYETISDMFKIKKNVSVTKTDHPTYDAIQVQNP